MSSKKVSTKNYLLVWLALMILLALTWGMAKLDLGIGNAIAVVVIALLKMGLVMLFFMHVRYNSRLTWVFAAAGFIWLLIMINGTLTDYFTRGNVRPTNRNISFWRNGPPSPPPGGNSGDVNPEK